MGPQVRKGGEILPLSPLVSATAFMGGGPKPNEGTSNFASVFLAARTIPC